MWTHDTSESVFNDHTKCTWALWSNNTVANSICPLIELQKQEFACKCEKYIDSPVGGYLLLNCFYDTNTACIPITPYIVTRMYSWVPLRSIQATPIFLLDWLNIQDIHFNIVSSTSATPIKHYASKIIEVNGTHCILKCPSKNQTDLIPLHTATERNPLVIHTFSYTPINPLWFFTNIST